MNVSVTKKFYEHRQLSRKNGMPKEREYLEPGLAVPRGVSSNNIRELILKMSVRSGDVFICTYPKSGTTWMQAIVKLVMNSGVEDGRDIDLISPWIDVTTPSDIQHLQTAHTFKTHLPCYLLPGGPPPTNPNVRYIVVYRNPRDVAVSMFHHLNALKHVPNEWNYFIEKFISGDVIYGSYFKHLSGWLKYKDLPNVLILCYEDMKENLTGVVKTVATFLSCRTTDECISNIAQQTTFDSMRVNPATNYQWLDDLRGGNCQPFMRKGIIGDWKNYFTAEQLVRMDTLVEEAGYCFKLKFD